MVKLIPIPFERDKFALRVERVKDDRLDPTTNPKVRERDEPDWGQQAMAIFPRSRTADILVL